MMMMKIISEITSMLDTTSLTTEQVLAWEKRVEAQTIQTTILESLKERKDFDTIRSQKPGPKAKQTTTEENIV